MKILITGIGGFVGPYLQACLKDQGHEVFGFERTHKEPSKTIFYGDILNLQDIDRAMAETAPDAVVHLAGFSSAQKSFDEPELCHRINVQGTQNLLDSCMQLKQKPRLLLISSAEIYGKPQFTPLTEEHSLDPTSPYGQSRLDQEKLVESYQKDLEIIIIRSFNHTGPAQQPLFVVPDFVKQLIEIEKGIKPPILSVGNLEAVRDFTDVRDIVKAYAKALTHAKPGQVYNLCSGVGRSIQQILDQMIQFSGLEVDLKQDPARLRPSDIPTLIGSHEKFTRTTGWIPAIPFEQTLIDMLNWWRVHI